MWSEARVAELIDEPAKEVAKEMKRLMKAKVIERSPVQATGGAHYRRKWD